jgi:hypothetical protein
VPPKSGVVERFTQIKNDFLRDKELSPAAKLVGVVFASYANAQTIAWPGTTRLMHETRLGRDAVQRGRATLVKGGYLKKLLMRGKGGKIRNVRYLVTDRIIWRRRANHLPENS